VTSSDTRLWHLGKFSLTQGIPPQTGAFDVQGVSFVEDGRLLPAIDELGARKMKMKSVTDLQPVSSSELGSYSEGLEVPQHQLRAQEG
jgi:hypothetical protein